ncbi:MAG TPA: hypothetical protein PKY12_12415 [Catalimonadaceae bacterium]|nr:hypothetical protein [Catalimonadaceae bacterium]
MEPIFPSMSFTNKISAKVAVALFLLLPHFSFGQNQPATYRKIVKRFYELLLSPKVSIQDFGAVYEIGSAFKDNEQFLVDSLKKDVPHEPLESNRLNSINPAKTKSYIHSKMIPFIPELTYGLSYSQISKCIDQSKTFNDGIEFGDYLVLNFPNGEKIYFGIGNDPPSHIEYIWLSDGILLNDKVNKEKNPQKLLLVGAIADKDGFAYVRQKPAKDSRIKDSISAKDYFYYVPNSNSNWLEVTRSGNPNSILGYIHKSRILPFESISDKIKKRVKKDRGGC